MLASSIWKCDAPRTYAAVTGRRAIRGACMQRTVQVVAVVTAIVGGSLAVGTAAHADGPGVGAPWIVSIGDSAISGEAGRWAGNTNDSSSKIDALGSSAYYDNAANTAEQIPGCHRSKAAEVHIG